jgi:hypothetical protein
LMQRRFSLHLMIPTFFRHIRVAEIEPSDFENKFRSTTQSLSFVLDNYLRPRNCWGSRQYKKLSILSVNFNFINCKSPFQNCIQGYDSRSLCFSPVSLYIHISLPCWLIHSRINMN